VERGDEDASEAAVLQLQALAQQLPAGAGLKWGPPQHFDLGTTHRGPQVRCGAVVA
jgi:hypothetical protein